MIKSLFLIFFISLFIFSGCGDNKQSPENQAGKTEESENKGDLENFSENMQKLSESFTEGKKVNPVDFRDLKSLLPEQIGNLKRTNASGEKTSAMGINISKAEADYTDEANNKKLDIEVTDLGSISGLTAFGAYGWYMADIDKETEEGYEKTFLYKGNKGYEKYNNKYQDGNLSLLVAKRFVVEINGNNVSMDEMKSALDMLNIGKLESMKDYGIEK
jgi:hypothetical protein